MLDPAARLVVLAMGALLPAALALHTGRERLALAAGAVAVAAYYLVVLRSTTASRLLLGTDTPVLGA